VPPGRRHPWRPEVNGSSTSEVRAGERSSYASNSRAEDSGGLHSDADRDTFFVSLTYFPA